VPCSHPSVVARSVGVPIVAMQHPLRHQPYAIAVHATPPSRERRTGHELATVNERRSRTINPNRRVQGRERLQNAMAEVPGAATPGY
jgi:hypothetical protein